MQDYLSGRLFWFLVRNWDLSFDILVFFQSIYLPEKLKKWVIALETGVWVCGSRCGHLWLKTMATVSNNGSISPRCVHPVPIQSLTRLSVFAQWTVATTNWFSVNVTHSFHISSFLERKWKPQKWKFLLAKSWSCESSACQNVSNCGRVQSFEMNHKSKHRNIIY